MSLTILVTGASSGIGNLSAKALAKQGHTVYASMRKINSRNKDKAEDIIQFATANNARIIPVEMDILSQESVNTAVQTIIEQQGKIDVVVHNAGHLVVGVAEAFSTEEMAAVYDTNVLGTQRVNRAVLPYMRKAKDGLLVWVSSTTVKGAFPPFMGPYVAAKAAMDNLALTMSYEIAPLGIETAFIIPGAFTQGTAHFPNAGTPSDKETVNAYAEVSELSKELDARLSGLIPADAHPQAVAEAIVNVVGTPKGQRPFRTVIDFIGDGAEEVTDLSEKLRIEFMKRIGLDAMLTPAL
ncbi:NADP-dependent 3-hydroxy acid dehydrogenase YdfG [Paenibacillus sophorae]|uniref:NADP-dependent 3-hydroxy acid dehydrogenase YdfG n=1 Tax=Paenibacillus sophorae TaxID=1333845 RepID=A0A1H8Q522_9BACL|nr:SDR family oxidoreductase [Paenibacillus sophorae]QWU15265.1 SDR family oxidoreductase [Paenibacillus sophorae]SEO49320.1 NADP-dependent 3-hydroxy acid dehydrogenase YdfG [Paenibacillus sophorae]